MLSSKILPSLFERTRFIFINGLLNQRYFSVPEKPLFRP